MKILTWTGLLLLLLSTPACFFDFDDDDISIGCRNADGPDVSFILGIDNFDGIELNIAADVFISQGDEFEVIAEGPEEALEDLEDNIRNGSWIIDTRRCYRNNDEIDIFITMPHLREIRHNASGRILAQTFFVTDDVDLFNSGSGNIDLGLDSDDIDARISGSGDISIEGTADRVDLFISGSGDWECFDFATRETEVSISGSGDAEVRVLDFLRIQISGSGDVLYKGQPDLDVRITGSGEVRDAN
jgi:hypothetical protein